VPVDKQGAEATDGSNLVEHVGRSVTLGSCRPAES
jgi:hypothetical protein